MEGTTITVIPKKTVNPIDLETGLLVKKKVCAYARVSTDMDDQKNSFNAQLEYYSDYIKKNDKWEFVKLYSDEGISGTSIKNRKGFQEMIDDAFAGKIDLILTKSISRFARNTVDCLQKVRDLRSKGVIVYFEKENISTDDSKIEMMLTIFASMAQEESKSISENVKWGVRKRMAKGIAHINTNYLLGYEKDADGNIYIVPEQAKIVKKIFNLYIAGYSYREICDLLESEGIKTPLGKEKWNLSNIHSILSSEKYCGEALLQKTVVVDFLSHKAVKNNGIETQYRIKNHHPAIISVEDFEYVQELRKYNNDNYSNFMNTNTNPLSGLVFCEHCLRPLYRINQHNNKEYKRYVLTCKNPSKKNVNYIECTVKNTVDYQALLKATYDVFHKFFKIPDGVRENINNALINTEETNIFYNKANSLKNEIYELETKIKDIVTAQVRSSTPDSFKKEFDETKKLIFIKKNELESLKEHTFKSYSEKTINSAIDEYLKNNECISPILIRQLIQKIISMEDGSIRFIIGKDEFNLSKERIIKIKDAKPIYNGFQQNGKFQIQYDVIKEEDIDD